MKRNNVILITIDSLRADRMRWGDYFGASMDPSTPKKVWIYGEWARTSGWGTWVGLTQYT